MKSAGNLDDVENPDVFGACFSIASPGLGSGGATDAGKIAYSLDAKKGAATQRPLSIIAKASSLDATEILQHGIAVL